MYDFKQIQVIISIELEEMSINQQINKISHRVYKFLLILGAKSMRSFKIFE